MVVADTSALVAIVNEEPDAIELTRCLGRYEERLFPVSCYLEGTMVLTRRLNGRRLLDSTIANLGLELVPIDETVIRLAADAFERYGKGRGHRAQLNFGDCMAYAAAKARGEPLLFKGGDFALTDITPAR